MGRGRQGVCGDGGRYGRACLGELEWEPSPKITLKGGVRSAVLSGEWEVERLDGFTHVKWDVS